MKSLYQTSDGTIHIYSAGLFYLSACAPGDMPAEEVERRVRALDDPGTSGGWRPSGDTTFSGGQPNPCSCDRDPSRVHRLFCC